MNEDMRTRAALYPYRKEYFPLVKYFEEFQEKYILSDVIAPEGYGLSGRDVAFAVRQEPMGLMVQNALDITADWMTLLVIEPEEKEEALWSECINYIRQALESGKRVEYYCSDRKHIPQEVLRWSQMKSYNLTFHMAEDTIKGNAFADRFHVKSEILDVPFILFGGTVQEADVMETMLIFALELQKQGMNCLLIANDPIYQLIGADSVRYIIKDKTLEPAEKVQQVNWMMKDLEMGLAPDVILLEAPDALMTYNEFAPNGYGLETYMVSQAHQPDYLICNLPCDLFQVNMIEMISSALEKKLGCGIDAAGISNVVIDAMDVMQSQKISIVRMDEEMVEHKYALCKQISSIPVFRKKKEDIAGICSMLGWTGEV